MVLRMSGSKSEILAHDLIRIMAIDRAKDTLCRVPFQNIGSYASILFDKEDVSLDNQDIQEEIKFLKDTKLKDMIFEVAFESQKFVIKNNETNASIMASNRISTKGEFRGEVLRNYLEEQKKVNPEQTGFDVITRRIKDPQYSNIVMMLKSSLTSPEFFSTPMSKKHYDLFISEFLKKLHENIKMKNIEYDPLNEKININDIEYDSLTLLREISLQNILVDGIDIETIYDATLTYQEAVDKLQEITKQPDISKELNEWVSKCLELADNEKSSMEPTVPLPQLTKALQLVAEAVQDPKNNFSCLLYADFIAQQYHKKELASILRQRPKIAAETTPKVEETSHWQQYVNPRSR